MALCIAAIAVPLSAQMSGPKEPLSVEAIMRFGGETTERSIMVSDKINLSMCVTQGRVKVNGWKRNEMRVLIKDGSKFGFKILQKNTKTHEPEWIMITSIQTPGKYISSGECVWGSDIEIDLPINASVNIKGQDITTSIDSVRKVGIRSIGGDISVRNVSDGVAADSGQGDIMVDASGGPMSLDSTRGNIVVNDAAPSDFGDVFKAKTNGGAISLQNIEHRQVEGSSISGSVVYTGSLLNGGSYSFSTSNGSIRLALPTTTSCKFWATYGFGNFVSDIPLDKETENLMEGPIKSIQGKMGSGGEALLKLTTNNGSIQIKKQ